jgi:hypothetical protein
VQEVGSPVERQVRDDAERLARKRERGGVGFDHLHVGPAATEPACKTWVELDCDYAARDPRELARDSAGACAEIDDKVVCAHPGIADKLLRDRAIKKVLATRRGRPRTTCAPACHGKQRSRSASPRS